MPMMQPVNIEKMTMTRPVSWTPRPRREKRVESMEEVVEVSGSECRPAGDWIQKTRIKIAAGGGARPIMRMSELPPMEKREKAPVVVDRTAWPKPWAQLKYFTFQPAIFPRL